MKILTLETLKQMPPHTIIAHGETIDNPDGINIDNSNHNLYWVAKRGEIHDWAIYVCPYPWSQKKPDLNQSNLDINTQLILNRWYAHKDQQDIIKSCSKHGNKLRNIRDIQKLVPCNDEALRMYRH